MDRLTDACATAAAALQVARAQYCCELSVQQQEAAAHTFEFKQMLQTCETTAWVLRQYADKYDTAGAGSYDTAGVGSYDTGEVRCSLT